MRWRDMRKQLENQALTILAIVCLIFQHAAYSQAQNVRSINSLIQSVQKTVEKFPIEKLHVQFDKPWYYTGDTLWFKTYLFDAGYLTASTKSGLIYVDIADDTNRLIKRLCIPVSFGLSWGNIALDTKLPAGAYTFKAYTSWMLNFREDQVFKKRFYINDVSAKPWLIGLRTEINGSDKQFADINLNVFTPQRSAISSTPVQLRILEGGKTLDRSNFITDVNGSIALRFPLPQRSLRGDLTITLENRQKNESGGKLYIPVPIDRPAFMDLQFLPESGYLVENVPARIGVKNIGENGLGRNISGSIVNQAGEVAARFHTDHDGMGSFDFLAKPGQTYKARVEPAAGEIKEFAFAPVRSSGTMLKVINRMDSDSVQVMIMCPDDVAAANKSFMLMAQARNLPCWGANIFVNKRVTRISIDKKYFPDGITKFTLLSSTWQPLNERMIFIRRKKDEIKVTLKLNKSEYQVRDSVHAELVATDQEGNPVEASFSVAITDNNQVSADKNFEASLVSSMLLNSDLKGSIEDPGYYFQDDSSGKISTELDNLLLTQGWRGYDWTMLLEKPPVIKYEPEQVYGVKGRVTNMFNKPVKNTSVILLSRKPMLFIDTKTNDSGVFVFADLPPSDTASFLIQARNSKGKSFNVGIEVTEFKPPVIANLVSQRMPWYVNIDTARFLALGRNTKVLEKKAEITGKSQMLAEVFVIGKKVIRDSKNLNGPGESDFAMNAADLAKAGKMTLGELIEKNIEGFHIGGKTGRIFKVNSMTFHLVIDGITVDKFLPDGISLYDYYKSFFDYYTAEDIKGVELMKTGKYQMSYTREYIENPLEAFYDHAFVEVTTYSGSGPFMKRLPGVYLYKPLPLTIPSTFYAPKYSADSSLNPLPGTDTRSTIHWEPNLITDKDGKATFSFFTADYPGNYSIIIEGSNMNGMLGTYRSSITIK